MLSSKSIFLIEEYRFEQGLAATSTNAEGESRMISLFGVDTCSASFPEWLASMGKRGPGFWNGVPFLEKFAGHAMDRINKFLTRRQRKHEKNIKYGGRRYTITKDDLKLVRAYRSGRCLDPSIKSIPSRSASVLSEPIQPLASKKKKDASAYFNSRLKNYYLTHPKPKIIRASVNEVIDIWDGEDLDTLKSHVQEWTYSIESPYEGRVEDLRFTKECLELELRRVHTRHFRPRDPRSRLIRDILPDLPKIEDMRPFPEMLSSTWEVEGKKMLFGSKVCSILENRVVVVDLKWNKTVVDHTFDEPILRVCMDDKIVVSSRHKVYAWDRSDGLFREVLQSPEMIKDVYIDRSFVGYLTSRSIVLHDSETFAELKILKLKGDAPHKIKISRGVVYASTHKGIIVDSEEKTEIRNLGYVVDFAERNGSVYAVNNLSRLIVVDSKLRTVGAAVQDGIGSQIRLHPVYDLLAIVFSNEIGMYKISGPHCMPIRTIEGSFRSISWDEEMPWLYASRKNKVALFT